MQQKTHKIITQGTPPNKFFQTFKALAITQMAPEHVGNMLINSF